MKSATKTIDVNTADHSPVRRNVRCRHCTQQSTLNTHPHCHHSLAHTEIKNTKRGNSVIGQIHGAITICDLLPCGVLHTSTHKKPETKCAGMYAYLVINKIQFEVIRNTQTDRLVATHDSD